MVGLLLWKEEGRRAVTLREQSVLQVRMLRAEVLRTSGTPEKLLRRRVAAAGKKLRKQGVTEVILPEAFPFRDLLIRQGLRPVSTVPLRQALAADWVSRILTQRSIRSGRVAVCADRLTGEVVRAVTELALRNRYILLELPHGGEELSRRLRREYGVSVILNPTAEQLREAGIQVLFTPEGAWQGPAALRLYDEEMPLPPLTLPPALEERLPAGADRGQLLTVLREAGVIRTGQIAVQV